MCGPSQNLPQEGRAFTGIDTDTCVVTVTHGGVVPDTFANSQETPQECNQLDAQCVKFYSTNDSLSSANKLHMEKRGEGLLWSKRYLEDTLTTYSMWTSFGS